MTVARDSIWLDDKSDYLAETCETEDCTLQSNILKPIACRENIPANASCKVGAAWTQLREIEMLKSQLHGEEKRRMQAETQLAEFRATRKLALDMQAQLQAKNRTIDELQHRCEELERIQHKSQSQVWQAQKLESSFRKELKQARAILNDCEQQAHQLCGENAFLPPDIAKRRSFGGAAAPQSSPKEKSRCMVAPKAKVIRLDEWYTLRHEIEKQMRTSHREMQSQVDTLRAQVERNEKRMLSFSDSEQRLQKELLFLESQLLAVKAVHRSVVLALLGGTEASMGSSSPAACTQRPWKEDAVSAKAENLSEIEYSLCSVEVDLHATFAAAANSLEQAFETAGMGSLGLQSEFERLSIENASIQRRLQHQEDKIAELHWERQLLAAELSAARAQTSSDIENKQDHVEAVQWREQFNAGRLDVELQDEIADIN